MLKKRLGFENKKVILFVGRLHPIKDPLTLIEAYQEVSRLIDNTCLIIVGDGPMRETILNLLSKNNISAMVLGNRYGNDLLSIYQCADLFVMPSLGESFGLTLAEAMACGCPCIANKSGALPEILDIEDLLVEPKNVKVLANTMRNVLENPEAASNYSECLARRIRRLLFLSIECAMNITDSIKKYTASRYSFRKRDNSIRKIIAAVSRSLTSKLSKNVSPLDYLLGRINFLRKYPMALRTYHNAFSNYIPVMKANYRRRYPVIGILRSGATIKIHNEREVLVLGTLKKEDLPQIVMTLLMILEMNLLK